MAGFRHPQLDSRVWAAATWSAPVVVPLEVGLSLLAVWLLGKWSVFDAHDTALVIVSVIVTTGLLVALAGFAIASPSPIIRGLATSVAGSAGIVLVGGFVFGALI